MINHKFAGLAFGILGVIFLVLEKSHMGHSEGMAMSHSTSFLGMSEMSWMWFSMAVVHYLIKDCSCKGK